MADPIEPLPESEKDLTGEFRKDLRAVEALQRYFGAAPNRPASNARVVSAGDAGAQAPEESSPYNPTDFLGLNAEIESLITLPPEGAPGAASADASGTGTDETETEQGDRPSWLLELDEQRANAQGAEPVVPGSQDPRGVPRATALEASFVEPEGHKERTGRMLFPVLAAAAVVAALFTAWKLTTERVPSDRETHVAVKVQPPQRESHAPDPSEAPGERWAVQPDGSLAEAPVGSPELGDSATEHLPDESTALGDSATNGDATLADGAGETVTSTTEPTESETGTGVDESTGAATGASEVLTALDELVDTPPGEPEQGLTPWNAVTPFPWPATLVSVLMDRQSNGQHWQSLSDRERFLASDPSDPTSGTALAEPSFSEPAAPASIEVSAEELGRWLVMGPPQESASGDGSVAENTAEDGQGDSSLLAGGGGSENSFSTLRRARDLATNHWWGHEIPEHLIAEPRQVFTPDVGRVRVTTEAGEVFIGRLAWVGNRMLSLEAETGSLTLRSLGVRRLERLMERTKPKTLSPADDLAGLAEVRVAVAGGHLVGRLLEQQGTRVTLLTPEGGRVTVESDSVEPVRGQHSLALIRGRVPEPAPREE